MRTLGIVPARGGSKGLPGKNLMALGGRSLIRRALDSAADSALLTDYVVTTDSDAIAAEAVNAGGRVIMRPAELATDECGMVPVLQHAARAYGGRRPDLIVCLQPTSPFRTGAMIDGTIRKVIDTGADSAQTVTEAPYSPFHMSTLRGDFVVPLLDHGHTFYGRRQDCPTAYMPNGAVYVTRWRTLMDEGRVLGDDNRAVVCGFEESVNIDTIWDYRLAEVIEAAR